MTSMLRSNRRRHGAPKSRPRLQSLQKPNGVIGPRVQKVGGAHFAIVCVDPAKHRSEWMMAEYFGNLLIEPRIRRGWIRYPRGSSVCHQAVPDAGGSGQQD